ncbi:MAG: error-prone DNA polymerase [Bryobacteraceae bacterium]
MSYIELHARSAFSFLEGASLPEEIAARCAELDLPAVAVLDRNSMSGAARFHKQAQKSGIRAILGAEVAAAEGFRYSLLAESQTGYQNLCRMITKIKMRTGHGDQEHAVATREDIAEHAEGLICLTGGDEGPLAWLAAPGSQSRPRSVAEKKTNALREVEQLVSLFGPRNVYVELQRHFDRDEERRNQIAVEIARKLKLPLLATNGVSHAIEQDRDLLDALTCVRHKTTIAEAGKLLSRNAERHLKTAAQMQKLFRDLPEAVTNTQALADRLQFTLRDLGYKFPAYPVPPGETMNSYLRQLADQGARNRYRPYHEKARGQIERELAMIEKLDLAGYFLIVWDIVRFCKQQGLLVQGRGSAANSAVCYALEITAVDPVGMDLLFERFLSEERGEWPDIDLDLASGDERERAIQYVYQRYGQLGAAMTANVITYRGRSAARDIGKVLGFDEETLGRLSKVVPYWGFKDEDDTAGKQFAEAGIDVRQPVVQQFLSLFERTQDLPRHLGQHSGGMVICQGQLDSIVPLQPATMPGRFVVQWDKEDCADMGIVKVDLLGLGMMAVMKESINLIRDHYGEEVDLAHLPADDPQVYSALQRADTIGMFQVESRAQMSFLPQMKPDHFYDIVVQVAIIRPGPIVGKMLHPYLRRRQGLEAVSYPHPALKPVLERTLGVPLFQEQLLRMAMIVAGFTGGQAEELRRAMGFKRSEKRMKEVETELRAGMTRNGISKDVQDLIVRSIGSFAAYGFPESHAASFALLAYASAYLKSHYLAAFTAAILNNQPMGFYHPATLVKDAQRHGLHFRPIDLMRSEWECTLEEETREGGQRLEGKGRGERETGVLPVADGSYPLSSCLCPPSSVPCPLVHSVRLGFNYLKGMRREVAERIINERQKQPFESIRDLVLRVPEIRKEELNLLAEAGALNCLKKNGGVRRQEPGDERERSLAYPLSPGGLLHRREALWQAEVAARPVEELLEPAVIADEECPLDPMNDAERLLADYRSTSLTIGMHPMKLQRERMNKLGVIPASGLSGVPNGKRVRIAGAVICRQRPGTASGFVFISLEDETGISNAIVEPDLFQKCKLTIVGEAFLVIEGILQNQRGSVSVKAAAVRGLRVNTTAAASHDFH